MSAMPLPPVHYLLYFKLGSVELLPESRLLLPEIAGVIKERHPAQLSIVGHTDTVESVTYNYQLGLLRARTAAELLASHGAAPASSEISSRGKTDLLVKTPDQTLEPRNRRAGVTIQ
jgi:outer membrane protein OmpA-like peptidoglycan-associated protein